jgi:TPR repeat protein
MPVSRRAAFHALAFAATAIVALWSPPIGAAESNIDAVQRRLVQAADDYMSGDHTSAWFRFWALAHEGHAPAQFNLGQLYRAGHGVPADLGLARYWYEEAAAQGHGFAQYNLGIMYERGDGTPTDLIEARAWYRRAAAQDVAPARAALDRLDRQGRQREGWRRGNSGLANAGSDGAPSR